MVAVMFGATLSSCTTILERLVKDTFDPFLSTYSDIRRSALDDETVEGEFSATSSLIRQKKGPRLLRILMTEISALETCEWSRCDADGALRSQRRLTGCGAVTAMITLFDLEGRPLRLFQEIPKINICPASRAGNNEARPDGTSTGGADAALDMRTGFLYTQLEPLHMDGEHTEPVLELHLTMGKDAFQRAFALVETRSEEFQYVVLTVTSELYGSRYEFDAGYLDGAPEYGMLWRDVDPWVSAPARIESLEVTLASTQSISQGRDWPTQEVHNAVDVSPDFSSSNLITNRRGWVIAWLVIIMLILLFEGDWESEPDVRQLNRQLAVGFPIVKTGLTDEGLTEARNTRLVRNQGPPRGIYDAFG